MMPLASANPTTHVILAQKDIQRVHTAAHQPNPTSLRVYGSPENTPPITEAQLKDIQAIVILGGGKNNNAPEYRGIDTINKATLERLRYGAQTLFERQGLTVTLAGTGNTIGEQHAIGQWLPDANALLKSKTAK